MSKNTIWTIVVVAVVLYFARAAFGMYIYEQQTAKMHAEHQQIVQQQQERHQQAVQKMQKEHAQNVTESQRIFQENVENMLDKSILI